MPDENKRTRILLRIAAVLALLVAASQTALYFYATAHFKEILQKGSVTLFYSLVTVTESAAQANPQLTAAVFCVLFAVGCLIGAHIMKKKSDQT